MGEVTWATPKGTQPAYVSMARDGKSIRVTVRQASINGLTPGPTAVIEVPNGDFETLMLEAMGLTDG